MENSGGQLKDSPIRNPLDPARHENQWRADPMIGQSAGMLMNECGCGVGSAALAPSPLSVKRAEEIRRRMETNTGGQREPSVCIVARCRVCDGAKRGDASEIQKES